jgi:integrase
MTQSSTKLFEQVRQMMRLKHYAYSTEKSYLNWIRRFIIFHDLRHPRTLGKDQIESFLSHLAVKEKVAASTQNLALNALLFLYRNVLNLPLEHEINAMRARRPKRIPTVLTTKEVQTVINLLQGHILLIAQLLYGSGLRISECTRLRVKDLDFERRQITIRDAKGAKDRYHQSFSRSSLRGGPPPPCLAQHDPESSQKGGEAIRDSQTHHPSHPAA